jgi:hypothetical protein
MLQDVSTILTNTPPMYLGLAIDIVYPGIEPITDGSTLLLLMLRALRVNEFYTFLKFINVARL